MMKVTGTYKIHRIGYLLEACQKDRVRTWHRPYDSIKFWLLNLVVAFWLFILLFCFNSTYSLCVILSSSNIAQCNTLCPALHGT